METTTFHWSEKDGIKIFAKDWKPATDPRAVICLVHGMGEHCSRYDHMAKFYSEHGIAMVGYDRRGHGNSEGKRGHTTTFEAFLNEIDHLLDAAKERYPGKPIILYGHSMGGNLVLNYFLRRNPDIALLVTTGAWIRLAFEPPKFLIWLARISNKIAPGFTQGNNLKTEHISTDPVEVKKYENDPLVHDRITSATAVNMFDACDWLLAQKTELSVPALIMHGSSDQIIAASGSQDFAANNSGDITTKLWEGMYHEVHNEKDKQAVFNYTLEWVNSKLA
ncbi:MAG: lysophospholipase [Bacteroidota bacterium]